jgi:hypothetical protein
MLVFLGVLGIILFGFLLTLILVPKASFLVRLALGYLFGIGLITLFMFLGYLVGFRFTFENTVRILIFSNMILAPLALLLRKRMKVRKGFKEIGRFFKGMDSFEKLIFGAILLFLLSSFILNIYYPVSTWDSLALYDWRAKIFVDTGGMEEGIARGFFFGYPFMTSLVHTFVYLFGGENPKFIYSLIFTAFAILFYNALRKFSSRKISLLITLALITIPSIFNHSTIAYTNMPYTAYFVMSVICLYVWMIKHESGYLAISAFFAGLSTWVRSSEPFWMVNLGVLILFCLWKKKFLSPVFYSLIFFPIQQPWKFFEARMLGQQYSTLGAAQASLSVLKSGFNLGRLVEILVYIWENAILSNILFFGLLSVIILTQARRIFKEKNFLYLILIFGYLFLIFIGSYIFSFVYLKWREVPGSLGRMVMFLAPLVLFYFGISEAVKKIFEK